MKTKLLKRISRSIGGDTIVEVVLCIAVLGVAMAVAYVSVSHSLQVGTDAGNRDRALGLAQQQMEIIKTSEHNDTALSAFTANPGVPFCIDPATHTRLSAAHDGYCEVCINNSGQPDASQAYAESSSTGCPTDDRIIYFNSLKYDSSTKVFTSNSHWNASNGSQQDQITFYYKLPQ
jgi:type II secretory pathway pseudopilin PulG